MAIRIPPAALLCAVTLCWGVQWPIMKFGLLEIGPWTFRGVGAHLASWVLLGFAVAMRAPIAMPFKMFRPILVVALFATTAPQILSGYGLSLMPASGAVILIFTMPLWAAIAAPFLVGDTLTLDKIIALALGLAGIALLIGPDGTALAREPAGPLFMLATAWSWGIGTVLVTKLKPPSVPTLAFTAWQLFLGSLPLAIGSFFIEPVGAMIAQASPLALFSLGFNVLVASSLCIYGWFHVVQIVPLHTATLATLLIPVIGVATAPLISSETVGFRELGALVLVVGALTFAARGLLILQKIRLLIARGS